MASLPPLTSPATSATSPIQPRKLITSPVAGLCTQSSKKLRDTPKETLIKELKDFIDRAMEQPFCIAASRNSTIETGCNCMHDLADLIEEEEKEDGASYMLLFAQLDWNERKRMIREWVRYATGSRLLLSGHDRTAQHRIYLFPASTTRFICKNAVCTLFGLGRRAWTGVVNLVKKNEDPKHGLVDQKGNRTEDDLHETLHEFFKEMTEFATPRATQIVRTFAANEDFVETDLRDTDQEVVDLPSSFTKRNMYTRLLRQNGWEYKWDAKGRLLQKNGLEGEQQNPVPGWTLFRRFWDREYPKLKIQRPREDICGECFVFANTHKYSGSKRYNPVDDDSDQDDDEFTVALKQEDPTALYKSTYDKDFQDVVDNEQRVVNAGRHVDMAKKQRLLFNAKKAEAVRDANKPSHERSYTFVADFAQNMNVPNYGSEQPGEAYYYSPLSAYVFGVVDCSVDNLAAYIYVEGEGKKGGNNVASLLFEELVRQGLALPGCYPISNKKPAKEINFVFDNCAGQNKNRMVLRFLFFVVKRQIACVARAIFLVRGHTKNDCDRMFNLMKINYRKKNTYTPQELVEGMAHANVTPIRVDPSSFLDWDDFADFYFANPKNISSSHIFTVDAARDSNCMWVQPYDGEPAQKQELCRKKLRDIDDGYWVEIGDTPQPLKPPGIQDIKWIELYDKWRPIVPEERRGNFKYYNEDPGPERRKKVKGHSKQAKRQRADRSRTLDNDSDDAAEKSPGIQTAAV